MENAWLEIGGGLLVLYFICWAFYWLCVGWIRLGASVINTALGTSIGKPDKDTPAK